MHAKCLKVQLFFLFLTTVVSFLFFYYQDALPDNMFMITSNSLSNNFFLYYISSTVAFAGHFFGPWIFFPFITFAVLYTFFYSKRHFTADLFNIIPLLGSFLVWAYLLKPILLGQSIHYAMAEYVPQPALIALGLLFPLAFLLGTFRGPFKDTMLTLGIFLLKIPHYISWPFRTRKPHQYIDRIKHGHRRFFSSSKVKLPSLLRYEHKEENPTPKEKRTLGASPTSSPHESYYSAVSILQRPKRRLAENKTPNETYFNDIIERIEEKLREFNIEGSINNVLKGPVVDTFELKLGAGVRVSKVRNISEDLSMALMGVPIRIVYPMIGRETVGIEVPRNPREIIYLEEVLNSTEYKNSTSPLPIAMGKNAFGETLVADLSSMPHMLVAGATGAGKSVFINTLILSLLVKKTPSQMKLILIDPKQLELALYAKLPHLIMPVLTNAKKASTALRWACSEMERRYTILGKFGVRNIEGLHQKTQGSPHPMDYLVIVIDEFADLILTKSGKEIENNVCRLAAKARACGIHLILATQRPSVDVITGLIKSNFPTRISFRVTSPIDSRTILSTQGAELLLGKGDMLYRQGISTMRVHSSLVDETEIESLMKKLSKIESSFHPSAMDFLNREESSSPYKTPGEEASDDVLYKEAISIVLETRVASASFLQRRLKIGHNRAARLIEEMESKGVIGPADGSKRRDILVGEQL